ncbi:MAG: energy-coupling factor transporter transmembrane protein EcfT [Anaerolineaceae bacterium]|nr:energy-coupling factor transporter transmembrane protein EcfT [Anaerolineaceae bacterium]
MNEFEFLRGLPFGPYLPEGSPLRRFDPRTRILVIGLLMIGLILIRHPAGLLLGLGVILLIWSIGRVPFEPLRHGWISALPFLVILALIQVLLRSGEDVDVLMSLGSLVVSSADLWAGIMLLLRFSAFIALLGLGAASLSESEITHGLQSLLRPFTYLGIPAADFVLALQVSLRYFPLLAQSAERIAKAQASRGADWRPAGWNLIRRAQQIVPLVVPLFVTSLRRAENMALAMDARGYASQPVRTSLVTLKYQLRDALALAAILVLTAAMFLL